MLVSAYQDLAPGLDLNRGQTWPAIALEGMRSPYTRFRRAGVGPRLINVGAGRLRMMSFYMPGVGGGDAQKNCQSRDTKNLCHRDFLSASSCDGARLGVSFVGRPWIDDLSIGRISVQLALLVVNTLSTGW